MAASILINTTAFDATKEHALTLMWSGNQAYKNRVVINNNTTNATVYDVTTTTNKLTHTIAAGSLTNGICYNAVVTVFYKDSSGTLVESSQSNTIIFYCYTTPTFTISNITADQIVRNSSYAISLIYVQAEGELLNEYQVFLYDEGKQQIYTSNVLRSSSTLSATIRGMQDNTQYYVRATGQTVNGIDIDTGYVRFSVEYISPSVLTKLSLENVPNDGCIKLATNFKMIEGNSNPLAPTYINNSAIDLTSNGSYVQFDEGFTINKDFKVSLIGRNPTINGIVLEMSNGTNKIEVQYLKDIFNGETVSKSCYLMRIHNEVTFDQITTSYFTTPASTVYKTLVITRKNNLYDIEVG